MTWLPDGEKKFVDYVTVSTEYRRVTDGQADGQTDILRRFIIIIFIIFLNLGRYIPEGFKKIEKGNIMGMIISPCNQGPANYHVTRWR